MIIKIKYSEDVFIDDNLKTLFHISTLDDVFYCDYNKTNRTAVVHATNNMRIFSNVISLDVVSPFIER